MFGDGKLVARIEPFVGDPRAVDLDAVAALQVFDVPIATGDRQLAMVCRDVGESQNDIAAFAAADEQRPFHQGNRVSASNWLQLSKHN